MPALYAPIIVMLLALIFRGVAFEFRWRAKRQATVGLAFAGGSIVAALAQGIALGALVQGIPVAGRAYAGGWWDWLTPFSILTGVALVVGYALLGATWLVMKTDGQRCRTRAYRMAWIAALGTLALIGIVSLWTPFLDPVFMHRWFDWPAILYIAPVPLLVAGAAFLLFTGLAKRRETLAVPRRHRAVRAVLHRPRHQLLSLHRAAAHHHQGGRSARQSLAFLLVGAACSSR